ncbi:cytochrome b [Stappia indica]|uniref:Cytochrome b561 n=1 Tax=Stappia indica TaxID=538381 RepID=A0A285SA50_9HYPH|nr:cytochrome b [Stappia indica]MCC4245842.1 cytochrome b [Stappia indica]SOC04155.1 cytochrome b561 [Stappia indica]
MHLRNTRSGYGLVAILFHWTMALLIIGLFLFGKYMSDLDPMAPDTFALYQLHKSLGFVVLTLMVARLAWRFANPSPALPETMPRIERLAAHLGHAGLYALMLAIPLSGWLMVSASPWGIPTVVFDTLPVPHLPVPSALGTKAEAESALKEVHELLANGLLLLVLLHAAAALKHHFINKDDVLRRMVRTGPAGRTD